MMRTHRFGGQTFVVRLAIAALMILAAAGRSVAQDLDFKVPEFDFLNGGKTFDAATVPYAEIGNFQRSLYPKLQARLFWEDEVKRRPHSVAAKGPDGQDRCYIFNATLLPVIATSSEIRLIGMPRIGGSWVVVFESGQWTKGPIKISSRAVDEYFRRGFRFSTESPKESWNPLDIVAVLLPQRAIRQATVRQRQENEKVERQRVAQEAAVDKLVEDPLCVWFRETNKKFLVAEKRPCGGCAPAESAPSGVTLQWATRMALGWMR